MKKQYRIIEKWYNNTDYYEVQYSYPFLPYWFFIGTRGSLDYAHQTIEKHKNTVRDPKPKVVHRE